MSQLASHVAIIVTWLFLCKKGSRNPLLQEIQFFHPHTDDCKNNNHIFTPYILSNITTVSHSNCGLTCDTLEAIYKLTYQYDALFVPHGLCAVDCKKHQTLLHNLDKDDTVHGSERESTMQFLTVPSCSARSLVRTKPNFQGYRRRGGGCCKMKRIYNL
jgi:hypothetical protein